MRQFDALCDLSEPSQRRAIESLRMQDATQAEQLARLLDADRREADFLDETGGAVRHVANLTGVVLDERWRLVEPLARGGGGEVWRAQDLVDGVTVAVKLLHPLLLDSPQLLRRFRREFRTLARLTHPGCLRAIAEGEVGEGVPFLSPARRYLVMEFIEGGDLGQYVGAPDAVLLPILQQVAAALDHLHRQQIIHRDIKPSNILVTTDTPARAKLADFGIIKLFNSDDTAHTEPTAVLGTVDYLSPEQVARGDVTPQSDLYALGCVIHALWAGEVPFGGDRQTRLVARTQQNAPSLAQTAPHAPPALVALTDQLLQRDPADRPASAYAVLEALATMVPVTVDAAGGELGGFGKTHTPPVHGAFLYPPGIVGRQSVRQSLRATAAAVRTSGTPAVVGVVGSAGLGKTSLVEDLAQALRPEGWRVVTSYIAQVTPGPFSPFPRLVASLHPDAVAFPPVSTARPELEVVYAQQRLATALVAALSSAARTSGPGDTTPPQPVCLVLDDVHLASSGAVGVLARLPDAATAIGLPLLVLVTGRPQLLPTLDALPGVVTFALSPLSTEEAREMIARILGSAREELPERLQASLLKEGEGNPLLLRSAVRNLAQRGALVRTREAWTLADDAAPQRTIQSALEERLAALRPVTANVLRAASCIGLQFSSDVLACVAEVGEETLVDALAEGVDAAVIMPTSRAERARGDYKFDHARLAELLAARMPPEEGAALHTAIGRALRERGADASSVAQHLGIGTDPHVALDALDAAVAEARAAHDHGGVAGHLAQMIVRLDELSPEERLARGPALREQQADALVLDGAYRAAAQIYRKLEAGTSDTLTRGRILRKSGLALLRTNEPALGMTALQGALVHLGDPTPRTRTGRLLRLSWDALAALVARLFRRGRTDALRTERASVHRELALMYRWVDLYDAGGHLARFYRLATAATPAAYRVDANAMASMFFALQSMPGAAGFVREQARAYATASGDLVGLARLALIQGGSAILTEEASVSMAHMDQAVELARVSGDRWMHAFCLAQRAWTRGMVDSTPRAYVEFHEAAGHAASLGATWLEADASCGTMLSALAIGRLDEGEATARRLLTSDVRLGFPVFEQLAVEGLAAAALLRGRYTEAHAGFARGHALLRQHRLDEGWGWMLPMELVEAACCAADQHGAALVPDLIPHLRQAQRGLRRNGRLPLYAGCTHVAAGVVASRQGRPAAAHAAFAKATAARSTLRPSYIDTWTRVRPALERLHLGGDREEARVALDDVDARYVALGLDGMRMWLAGIRRVVAV